MRWIFGIATCVVLLLVSYLGKRARGEVVWYVAISDISVSWKEAVGEALVLLVCLILLGADAIQHQHVSRMVAPVLLMGALFILGSVLIRWGALLLRGSAHTPRFPWVYVTHTLVLYESVSWMGIFALTRAGIPW